LIRAAFPVVFQFFIVQILLFLSLSRRKVVVSL